MSKVLGSFNDAETAQLSFEVVFHGPHFMSIYDEEQEIQRATEKTRLRNANKNAGCSLH